MDNRSKLEKIIEYRKAKGSMRKPKYATRKLSMGLVSCMLGFTLLISPSEAKADSGENTATIVENAGTPETTGDGSVENTEEILNEDNGSGSEQDTEPVKEEKSLEKTQAEEFNAQVEEINVELNGTVDYSSAITNLPSDASVTVKKQADTSKAESQDATVEIKFADESTTEVTIKVNVEDKKQEANLESNNKEQTEDKLEETDLKEEKEQEGKDKSQEKTVEEKIEEPTDKEEPALEVGEKIGDDRVQATPEDGENTEENASGTENALSNVKVKITKKGIGDKNFNFDGIFGQGARKKVTLKNKVTGETQEAEFGSKEEFVEYITKIKMSDVVKDGKYTGNYSIEFEGGTVAGKLFVDKSAAKANPQTGETLFELTLWQVRNTDIEVKTKNKAGEVVENPTTDQTNGKIQSGNVEIDIPSKGESASVIEDGLEIEDLLPEEIEDINNQEPEYNLTGKKGDFLVYRDGNKAYKQDGEVKVDPEGLKPSELNLIEKPLVTEKDQTGDTDYATVEFDAGEHGTIQEGKTYYVIKGVTLKDGTIAEPKVVPNTGWKWTGWDKSLTGPFAEGTTITATYEADKTDAEKNDPQGQDINTKVGGTPKAEEGIKNKDDLPTGTKYEFKETPDTTTDGTKDATVVVTYPDGSTDEVAVKVNVTIDASTITPIPSVTAEAETVNFGGEYDLTDNIKNLPEGATVEDVTPEGTIDVNKTGNYTGKVKVTFKDGSSKVVDVPVTVGDSQATTNEPTGKDITVKKGETPKAEDAITNKDDLPKGTKYEFKETPDTTTDGTKDATVVVTYPDGSTDEVAVKVNVTIDASAITPIPSVTAEAETVNFGGEYDLTDNIKNLPEGATVEDVTPEGTIDVNKTGNYTGKVKVTFKDGSSKV
ncbi:Rib/alpha-like domain-containing protein, partial [Anaerococcus urinomassiliensis]|uniref:Rib/alpha-like domain-containing protein n=1 Tax=Anaerococcus urinomassiliensis TaxID=1745712 RepID=UPI002286DF31